MYLIRFSVLESPREEQNLCQDQRAKENDHHLGMHHVMAPVLLLKHTMMHSTIEQEFNQLDVTNTLAEQLLQKHVLINY